MNGGADDGAGNECASASAVADSTRRRVARSEANSAPFTS